MPPILIQLGEFGRAVGLKGEIRVKALTDDPAAIGDYGPLRTEDGRTFTIEDGRFVGENMVVVKLKEVKTREAAEALNRLKLYVERSALPEPEDDEFYHADLIGLAAHNEAGEVVGSIAGLYDHGAGDHIEIKLTGGKTVTLPFTKERVPLVDMPGKRVVVVV